jgi:hypothetical protein
MTRDGDGGRARDDDDDAAMRHHAAEQLVAALRDDDMRPDDIVRLVEQYQDAFHVPEPDGDLLRALVFGYGYGRGYSDGRKKGRHEHGA